MFIVVQYIDFVNYYDLRLVCPFMAFPLPFPFPVRCSEPPLERKHELHSVRGVFPVPEGG